MTVKYLFFYATANDIVPALQRLEAHAPLKFVPTGILPNPNRDIYLHSSELPAPDTSSQLRPTFMVSHRGVKNYLHTIDSDDGRKLWSLRNGDNEGSVLLDLGGLSKSGALLEGQMTTLHKTKTAQQLMRWFLSALKQQNFVRVQGCWIGPSAILMLKAGARLTQAEQAPRECDIRSPKVAS